MISIPDYSVQQEEKGRQDKEDKDRRKYSGSSYKEDQRSRSESVNLTQVTENLHEVCLYCSGRHDIDSCETFINLPHKEKRSYLFDWKICFYCYNKFSQCYNSSTATSHRFRK